MLEVTQAMCSKRCTAQRGEKTAKDPTARLYTRVPFVCHSCAIFRDLGHILGAREESPAEAKNIAEKPKNAGISTFLR